jgi:hypothetical protein
MVIKESDEFNLAETYISIFVLLPIVIRRKILSILCRPLRCPTFADEKLEVSL